MGSGERVHQPTAPAREPAAREPAGAHDGLLTSLRGMSYDEGRAALAPGANGAAPPKTAGAAPAPLVPVTDRPILRSGNAGAHVIELQTLLNEQAGAGLPVDSLFGPATRKAVVAFQDKKGLDRDGVVGPKTWGALYPGGAPAMTREAVKTPMSEKLVTGPGGATTEYKWESKYDIQWIADHVWVEVRIHLVGGTSRAERQAWAEGIRAKWNQAFAFTNGKRSISLMFVPVFTARDPHHVIKVVRKPKTSGDWDMGTFDAADGEGDTQGDAAAHEFGHMIGNADEYSLPDGKGGAKTLDGVMAIPSQEAKERHFTQFRDWLNAKRGVGEAEYKLVKAT